MAKSTFVRKNQTTTSELPSGTKKSVLNTQLIISTGLNDLDNILMGGFPVGTLVLIEEDEYSSAYKYLFKYFLGEGLATKQSIFVGSDDDSANFIKQLPHISSTAPSADSKGKQESLKIAWQYQRYLNDDKKQLGQTGSFSNIESWCHNFDFARTVSPTVLSQAKTHSLSLNLIESKTPNLTNFQTKLRRLTSTLTSLVNTYNSELAKSKQITIQRFGVLSLGSPSWGNFDHDMEPELLRFMHSIRGLLRSSTAVCLVTVPGYLMGESLKTKLAHIADIALSFNSFSDKSETSEIFAEADGLFQVKKLPRVNALQTQSLDAGPQYTYKLKRKKLYIETIHLPPEITRGSSTGKSEADLKEDKKKASSGLLCQPKPGDNSLDF